MRLTSGLWAAVLAATAVSAKSAASTASTEAACDEIGGALAERVFTSSDQDYMSETTSYWSTLLHELKPACLVLPQSAEEVSEAVKVLNKYPDVEFAVKSGGHSPNKRQASVRDGVLISMRDMAGATYDKETGLAHIKPGGEWNDVITDLEKDGVTAVGGRLGLVGVGGFLLQGGISFLSSKYGMAGDQVVSWEMVMADGEIRTIVAEDEPELAVALRGSGSQFGIATGYNVKAYPMGKVWGGTRMFSEDKGDEIFAALHNFIPNNKDDVEAAIIPTDLVAIGKNRFYLLFFYYGKEEPPTTGPFAQFLNIESQTDTTKTQNYSELLDSNGQITEILHSRMSFWTYTLPYVKDAPHMYQEIWNQWESILSELVTPVSLTVQASIDFQPWPAVIAKHSEERGGNAMGLTGDDIDRVVLEIQVSWTDAADDDKFANASDEMVKWVEKKVPEWTKGKHADLYLPLFMNDAAGQQNVTGTYKDYAKFKALQDKMDPDGFFSKRGGGFKY